MLKQAREVLFLKCLFIENEKDIPVKNEHLSFIWQNSSLTQQFLVLVSLVHLMKGHICFGLTNSALVFPRLMNWFGKVTSFLNYSSYEIHYVKLDPILILTLNQPMISR